ncbi:MAG: HIT family protein [Acidimicrobiia bacterium]
MPSVFTMILEGDLPGRFVYRDDQCAAFLTIEPLAPGHTLVVPNAEVEHWIDLEPALAEHLMGVAQLIGQAIEEVFKPAKVGLMIAGLEVPHVHLHVTPINTVHDLDFDNADRSPDPDDLDRAAAAITKAVEARLS